MFIAGNNCEVAILVHFGRKIVRWLTSLII